MSVSVGDRCGQPIILISKTIDPSAKIPFFGGKVECSVETINRINDLGLYSVAFDTYGDAATVFGTLEEKLWEKAHLLKNHVFKKESDFVAATQFLEVFCLFAAQSSLRDGVKNCKGKFENLYLMSSVSKAVEQIEQLSKININGGETEKKHMRLILKRINHLVEKIYTERITKTEQIAFIKYINKANKILKKFC